MSKFKIKIIRTDEYEVECNWTQEQIDAYREVEHDVFTQEDVARSLALLRMRIGFGGFIEGFGHVREYDETDRLKLQFIHDDQGELITVPDEAYTLGLSIKAIDEDENFEIEAEEI